MITINGQFTARRTTGQERFAFEIVTALDNMVSKGEYELVVPKNAANVPNLKNINIVKYGKIRGTLWEQICLQYYVVRHRRTCLNLCTVFPIMRPGIVCIHDLAYKVNGKYGSGKRFTLYRILTVIWHRFLYWRAFKSAKLILTVSSFSKQQMIDVYNYSSDNIIVLGNGWEHFDRIVEDNSIRFEHPEFFIKPYFFAVSSLTYNKNFKWVLEVARHHPQYNFFIAGNANITLFGTDFRDNSIPNVIFLGYISDGTVKYVMKNSKALLFPSFFEGFGIPPLEALSVGAQAIVSNTSCLPEIFGNTVHYISPFDTNVNLDKILAEPVESPDNILKKYSFTRFAAILDKECKKL